MDAAPLCQVSPENLPLGWGFIFEDVGFQPSSGSTCRGVGSHSFTFRHFVAESRASLDLDHR